MGKNLPNLMQVKLEVNENEHLVFTLTFLVQFVERSKHGGSWIDHSAKILKDKKHGHDHIWRDFLCDEPIYLDQFF